MICSFKYSFKKPTYRPALEVLERIELMSAGIPTGVPAPQQPAMALVSYLPPCGGIRPCGTGKGIVIITS